MIRIAVQTAISATVIAVRLPLRHRFRQANWRVLTPVLAYRFSRRMEKKSSLIATPNSILS